MLTFTYLGISQEIAIIKNVLVDLEVAVVVGNVLEDLVVIAVAKKGHADHAVVVGVKGQHIYFLF